MVVFHLPVEAQQIDRPVIDRLYCGERNFNNLAFAGRQVEHYLRFPDLQLMVVKEVQFYFKVCIRRVIKGKIERSVCEFLTLVAQNQMIEIGIVK
jgi:hypothetical protein